MITQDLPLVSILIPTYNRESLIRECVASALAQTYSSFEVIIVDNASNDGTWEICKNLASLDHRLRIYRNNTNIGPVANWKRCAELARGKLSKILFSDDILNSDCLAIMVPFLHSSTAFVYCSASVGKSVSTSRISYALGDNIAFNSSHYIDLVLQGRAPVSPGAVLIRTDDILRNLHSKVPTRLYHCFDCHGAGPDILLLLFTADLYPCVAHVSIPLVFFRHHHGSFSVSDQHNQVSLAYRSAFAYYLFSRNRKLWLQYVARQWRDEVKRSKRWTPVRSFLISLEGQGSMAECLSLLIISFSNSLLTLVKPVRRILQKLIPSTNLQ